MIRIQDILSDTTTLVEMYFTKYSVKEGDTCIDLHAPDNIISKIQEKYKNCKTTKYMTYSRNELTYVYDLTDDNQMVVSKLREKDACDGNNYVIAYKYSKLPTHLFPCVSDIDYSIEYTLHEYKLSNRLAIIIRKDEYGTYAYIEYKHSANVDVEKIQGYITNILQSI